MWVIWDERKKTTFSVFKAIWDAGGTPLAEQSRNGRERAVKVAVPTKGVQSFREKIAKEKIATR
jgi:hypothetical protein